MKLKSFAMIQRIQSVYLFLTTLLSFLFLKGSFLNFANKSGLLIKVTFTGIFRNDGGQAYELIGKCIPLSIIIILIPVLCLFTIFLFKKRMIQKLLTILLIIMVAGQIIISFYYSWHIITTFSYEIIPEYKMAYPVLMLILIILAYLGIKKDENLIKSYDRLR